MNPTAKQPLMLITNVLHGNELSTWRSTHPSAPYRESAPSAPPTATPRATAIRQSFRRRSYQPSTAVQGEPHRRLSSLLDEPPGTIPDLFGAPVRVHDMTGDDLGIAHVPTPAETGDISLLEHGEYRVLDVIPVDDERSPLYALVRAQPAHVRHSLRPEPRSLNRVILTRKGDFSLPRPMMWIWGKGNRTDRGSALPAGKRGAPGPVREIDRESMPLAIRELVKGWGGESEPRHDEERLAALRRGRLRA